MKRIHRQQGFTLLDIMLVLIIFVLLATFGLPAYGDLVSRNRLNAATVQVMSDLMLARKRALSQQHSVRVFFDSPNSYRIWNDLDNNGRETNQFDRDEVDNRDLGSFGAKMKSTNNPTFWPSGSVTSLATITLRHPGVSNKQSRCITISITGRIKQTRCTY
ncbi:MAG: hypothetical protein ETSY2_31660 [Candidatus Entotheonella gemina]|uniref:Type II secretion system protein H n=1 Tax=Candidatus Entotheonella gemina TaxID=1429439 RepID=W4M0S7_9BACT|nr:MAG: hypothetical protein ETSY2_31660 [Candidatus Entotheonella gemina]